MNRIVLTSNTSWNLWNFRRGLINSLITSGNEIYLVSPRDSSVEALKGLGVIHYPIEMNQKGTNPLQDIKLINDYKRIFEEINPAIVLSFTIKPNIYSSIVANKLRIPIINNISGLGTIFIKKSISTIIGYLLYLVSVKHSSWVFFQNTDDAKLFLQLKLTSNLRSSVIAGSGVNTSEFNYKRTDNPGLTYLFVGRLIGDKGIKELMEAIHSISLTSSNVRFLIVGELGPNNKTAISRKDFEEFLEDHSCVEYLGKQDNMVPIYAKADVMILPSYREGLSKSLIEACAMSLPVITTDVPGCRDVVQEGFNGFLCEPRSVQSLVNRIEEMIMLTQEQRLTLGKNGRYIAESKYSEELVINSYLKRIHSLLNKSCV